MYHFTLDRYQKLDSIYNEVKSEANILKSYNINHSLELNEINNELKTRTEEVAHL
jgi:archaellum component FlaC